MYRVIIILLLILLNGCSFNNYLIKGEIDKVNVVKYMPYTKHHRVYFSRDKLKIMENGGKYLYLYNEKNNDLAILLHRKNNYILYSLSQPKRSTLSIKTNSIKKYTSTLKDLARKGYKTISSPASKGFIVSVSHKRYKGVKTLLVEIQEYTDLQNLYKNAIKTYDASKIKNIKTKLPKSLISDYYMYYKKQATTDTQLIQLQIIAKKLQIKDPLLLQNVNSTENKVSSQEYSKKPHSYYLEDALLNELSTYISKETTKNSLSYSEYRTLKQREIILQEEKLLDEGSMEELIEAYKVNKNPKYKERIMSLMVEKQKN